MKSRDYIENVISALIYIYIYIYRMSAFLWDVSKIL